MNFRPGREEPPADVNLTPLIDVVFLLLIFFMVSTTFDRATQLQLQLPEASGEPAEAPPRVLEISVTREGAYFVGKEQVLNARPETLRRAIEQVLDGKRDVPVVVRADAQAPWQAVVTVMDVLGGLGLQRLSLATVQPAGGGD